MRSLRTFAIPGVLALAVGIVGATAANAQSGPTLRPSATNPLVYLTADPINGAQEFPTPVVTAATGMGTVTVNPTSGEICANVTTTGLSGPITMSHIHTGAAGAAGAVVVDFAVTTGTSYAKCVTNLAEAAAIVADPTGFYVNVHTADNTGGEIRGQLALRPSATLGDTVTLTEPVRAYDSRQGTDGPLAPNGTRVIDLTSGLDGTGATLPGVPMGAKSAIVTVTVTQTVDSGYVVAYSNAVVGVPATSTVNWSQSNQSVASTTTVALDGAAKIKLTAGPRGTQVIVDVIGYVL
jgi:hypothetical protein